MPTWCNISPVNARQLGFFFFCLILPASDDGRAGVIIALLMAGGLEVAYWGLRWLAFGRRAEERARKASLPKEFR